MARLIRECYHIRIFAAVQQELPAPGPLGFVLINAKESVVTID